MKTCGVFTVTLYPKTVNVLSAPSMKEHPILTRLGFQVLETQDTGSDSMSTDAQHSQNHSETGGGEILLFFLTRDTVHGHQLTLRVFLFSQERWI